MKSYFLGLLLACSLVAHAAPVPVADKAARFDFRGINVAQAVQLIYGEALHDAFVIDPEVLTDPRSVSFRYSALDGDLRSFVRAFFDSLGLEVTRRSGVDFVAKKREAKEALAPELEVFVYRPKNRSGSYLVDLVSPLLKGEFTARRTVRAAAGDKSPAAASPVGSAASMIDRDSDTLVFRGPAAEVKLLAGLLPQVDVPVGGVVVRGVLYEVQTGGSDGSAVSLALHLLGGKLNLSFGSQVAGGNFVSLSNNSIDAVLSALSTDSRFVVKSTPTIRVQSGENGRFSAGAEVPVLSTVSYTGSSGVPVRSVEYRDTGVVFDLTPTVRADSIDLKVLQQVSTVTATQTGVNDSPTFNKREVKTSLSLKDGELVVIGGLAENKDSSAHSGLPFVPSFLHTRSSDNSRTEILLLLQVTKI